MSIDIKMIITIEDVMPRLIINWDQTGFGMYMPLSKWTMTPHQAEKVKITGINDKGQITAVLGGTLSGTLLPPQITVFMVHVGVALVIIPQTYLAQTEFSTTHTLYLYKMWC